MRWIFLKAVIGKMHSTVAQLDGVAKLSQALNDRSNAATAIFLVIPRSRHFKPVALALLWQCSDQFPGALNLSWLSILGIVIAHDSSRWKPFFFCSFQRSFNGCGEHRKLFQFGTQCAIDDKNTAIPRVQIRSNEIARCSSLCRSDIEIGRPTGASWVNKDQDVFGAHGQSAVLSLKFRDVADISAPNISPSKPGL